MKITKIVLHADAKLSMDYQSYATGVTLEAEITDKEKVEDIMKSLLPGLRMTTLNECKRGITKARKIAKVK